jgi:PilZ domain-containing protein
VLQRRKPIEARMRRRVEVHYADAAPNATDKRSRIGFSGNLSMRGMMIRAARVLPPGTLLTITLRFPQRSLTLTGRVIWARQGPAEWVTTGRVGMGIKFVDPPPDLEEILKGAAAPPAGDRTSEAG